MTDNCTHQWTITAVNTVNNQDPDGFEVTLEGWYVCPTCNMKATATYRAEGALSVADGGGLVLEVGEA